MLADELDYVVGVDTHRDQHMLAVVAGAERWAWWRSGRVRTNARGYADAVGFAEKHAPGGARLGGRKAPVITAPASPAT